MTKCQDLYKEDFFVAILNVCLAHLKEEGIELQSTVTTKC